MNGAGYLAKVGDFYFSVFFFDRIYKINRIVLYCFFQNLVNYVNTVKFLSLFYSFFANFERNNVILRNIS